MLKSYYQVAEFHINNQYRMQDFLSYRKDWWTENRPVPPGLQVMFLCTTHYSNGVGSPYYVEVKAYRRNTDSPHVGKVA